MTRAVARLAVVAALTAALALSACGRKGELEPPPESQAAAAAAN